MVQETQELLMKTFKQYLEENRLATLAAAGMIAGGLPHQEMTKDNLASQLKSYRISEPIRAEFDIKQREADSMSPVSGKFTSDRAFPSLDDPDLVIRDSPADKRGLSQYLMPKSAFDVFIGTPEMQNPLRGIDIRKPTTINRMSFNPAKNWANMTRDLNGVPLSGSKLRDLIKGDEELAKGIDTRPRETLDLNKLNTDIKSFKQGNLTGPFTSGGLHSTGIGSQSRGTPETGDSNELMIKRFRNAVWKGLIKQTEDGDEAEEKRKEINNVGEVG